jgi:hypothetical protein
MRRMAKAGTVRIQMTGICGATKQSTSLSLGPCCSPNIFSSSTTLPSPHHHTTCQAFIRPQSTISTSISVRTEFGYKSLTYEISTPSTSSTMCNHAGYHFILCHYARDTDFGDETNLHVIAVANLAGILRLILILAANFRFLHHQIVDAAATVDAEQLARKQKVEEHW